VRTGWFIALHMLMHACLVASCPKGQGLVGGTIFSHTERDTVLQRH
jgi:hypothetical protein